MKHSQADDTLRCSFCHKSQDVTGKLISSPSTYPRACICDECIAVCNFILLEDDKPGKVPEFTVKARIAALEAELGRLRNSIESKP